MLNNLGPLSLSLHQVLTAHGLKLFEKLEDHIDEKQSFKDELHGIIKLCEPLIINRIPARGIEQIEVATDRRQNIDKGIIDLPYLIMLTEDQHVDYL